MPGPSSPTSPSITSDNPRSEDPAAIIEDMLAGIEDRESVIVEQDRDAAIGLAIREAGPGDTVVIAGKGHEQGQEFENGRKIPFDDREVARAPPARTGREAGVIELPAERWRPSMGAEIVSRGPEGFPRKAEIDSRADRGRRTLLRADRRPERRWRACCRGPRGGSLGCGGYPFAGGQSSLIRVAFVFASEDPLLSLQMLARAWRRELGATVIGITGSVGKTSVKDITRALLPGQVHASAENFNTEIGLPLTILEAPAGTETLVLEMAMRGAGQIAELAVIAEPDIGVITNVGPVHVELLGSIEAVAAAKAELISGLKPGGALIVPVEAGHLEPHLDERAGPDQVRSGW